MTGPRFSSCWTPWPRSCRHDPAAQSTPARPGPRRGPRAGAVAGLGAGQRRLAGRGRALADRAAPAGAGDPAGHRRPGPLLPRMLAVAAAAGVVAAAGGLA